MQWLCADAAILLVEAGARALPAEVLEPGALVVGAADHGGSLWELLLRALDGQLRPAVVHRAGRHCGSIPGCLSSEGQLIPEASSDKPLTLALQQPRHNAVA